MRNDVANATSMMYAATNGLGTSFYNDANQVIYVSAATDATYGGRITGETTSDQNMYFKVNGGTNRGFVYKNGATVIAGLDASGNLRNAGTITATGAIASSAGLTGTSLTLSSTITGATNITASGTIQGATVQSTGNLNAGTSNANYISMYGNTTGNSPAFAAAGSDANINLTLYPKGTGAVYLGSKLFTGVTASTMAQNDTTSSLELRNNGGTGDTNMSMIAFHCTGSYAKKMGLRADGYFGWGGWSSGAWNMYLDPSSNLTVGGNVSAYSDPRLKENFKRVENPLDIIRALDGGTFDWKYGIAHTESKWGKHDYGILADQVEAVMPEIVNLSIDIDGVAYRTVDYAKLTPVLIEGVKVVDDRVAALEAKVARLEALLAKLID
jgi:hypothetical protein